MSGVMSTSSKERGLWISADVECVMVVMKGYTDGKTVGDDYTEKAGRIPATVHGGEERLLPSKHALGFIHIRAGGNNRLENSKKRKL